MRPGVVISSVVTPAASYNLVDLPTVKLLLGLTDTSRDAMLTRAIGDSSTAAQTFCNNPFVIETVQDQFFPQRDGWPWSLHGQTWAPLQLARWPIISIASVVETIGGVATTLTLNTDYLADKKRGQLTRLQTYAPGPYPPQPCNWRSNPIVAIYQAGYATIPGDVFSAVTYLVKMEYYAQNRDPLVRTQDASGVFSQSFVMGTGPGGPGDMPAYAADRLARYRVPIVA